MQISTVSLIQNKYVYKHTDTHIKQIIHSHIFHEKHWKNYNCKEFPYTKVYFYNALEHMLVNINN